MQTIKGFAAGIVALVACPCHLPLTLPILLVLTSGTAVGVWLATNQWMIWVASILLFIGGMALMVRWMNPTDAYCEIPQPKQAQASAGMEQHVQSTINLSTQSKEPSHV